MKRGDFNERVHRIVELLSKRTTTAAKIAKVVGMSKRQVYRDIDYLRMIGFDVPGEAGTGYAMHLVEQQPPVPPVFLLDPECMAVILALASGWRWNGYATTSFLADHFRIAPKRVTRIVCELRKHGYKIHHRRGYGYVFVAQPGELPGMRITQGSNGSGDAPFR